MQGHAISIQPRCVITPMLYAFEKLATGQCPAYSAFDSIYDTYFPWRY
ncbi:MAG TPA: hypothetical protein DEB17_04205 [Chlorobaculum sp.]|uniref:Uncharacterized protein n=1 Tax=Chlorobaculum tepidum (strain ATCC 49652 / DSM 12025 / NBRC 103806 / TLS) TaxID=194439 RepID=Q8KAE5_CHLTE|nr:hypothetical protein CT2218 [Chlorobaculum tepidum TLS]HBU23187.1 hypothetical protein [Chlorobaculum sp.]